MEASRDRRFVPASAKPGMSDPAERRRLSRRWLLGGLPMLLVVSGCGESAAERAHQRFFAAVKQDPMFSWRPSWVTSDTHSERSGDRPFVTDIGAIVNRVIVGRPVPKSGLAEAIAAAVGFGWREAERQILRRDLVDSQGTVPVELNVGGSDDDSHITFKFIMLAAS